LLRGHVNCEGQNHVLAVLLAKRLEDVHLFETIEPETGRARHNLVVFSIAGRRIFADAWSDVPLFHLDQEQNELPAQIPALHLLEARGLGERHGVQPRQTYVMGRVVPEPEQATCLKELIRDWNAPAPAIGTVRPREAGFVDYLAARLQHVLGNRNEALRLYRQIAQRYGGTPSSLAAKLFAERLTKG
jgi:hypothetical protein